MDFKLSEDDLMLKETAADLAAKLSPQTRLVWLEAAGSVTLEFPDLCEQVRLCRAAGVLCALDNTWGAGLAFKPFDLKPGDTSGEGLQIGLSQGLLGHVGAYQFLAVVAKDQNQLVHGIPVGQLMA